VGELVGISVFVAVSVAVPADVDALLLHALNSRTLPMRRR
jgi:hypothetical protein